MAVKARYIKIKRYKKSIGKTCMHCGRSATVRAYWREGKFDLPVRYCEQHAIERGVPDKKDEVEDDE